MDELENAANALINSIRGDLDDLLVYAQVVIETEELQAILARILEYRDLVHDFANIGMMFPDEGLDGPPATESTKSHSGEREWWSGERR